MKLIVEKLKESGSIGWREKYEVLLRKWRKMKRKN